MKERRGFASGWSRVVLAVTIAAMMAPAARAEVSPPDDAWMANLEGGWSGDGNHTPMGEMPFVMIFDRQADGSLRCKTAANRETFIELHFNKADDGRWLLLERAGMEGVGVQEYTLDPVDGSGDLRRWAYAQRPGFLTVDVAVDDERLFVDVRLRGEPHATFELTRMPDEEIPKVRRALARLAELPASEAPLETMVTSTPAKDAPAADPVAEARAAVEMRPEDAGLRMKLAEHLVAAIQRDPSVAPMYAFELLQTLQKAITIDPQRTDAYRYLVGYYLSAPPIAGGSVAKAEETARKVAAYDADAGQELLTSVAAHKAAN